MAETQAGVLAGTNIIKDRAQALFFSTFAQSVESFEVVCSHASARELFRLRSRDYSVIAAYNPMPQEDEAFVSLTEHFRKFDLLVPQLYGRDVESHLIMMQDLGDVTLFNVVQRDGVHSARVFKLYKLALEELSKFQLLAGPLVDFSKCFPRERFDQTSMLYDMREFLREFVGRLPVTAAGWEDEEFVSWLEENPLQGFMYRDFQSRNMMVDGEDRLWFIDFQGGRRGPLQYDVISLLFQSRTNLSPTMRGELLEHYLNIVEERYHLDREQFLEFYDALIILRMMQVLGTYGRVGLGQGKPLFVQSIPSALDTLADTIEASSVIQERFPKLADLCFQVVRAGKQCFC